MKRKLAAIICVAAICVCAELGRSVLRPYAARAQDGTIAPAENLIVAGVPAIPASLVETAGRYGSYRSATLADWSPTRREMLIATRFADTAQLHLVKMPGGEREQLTFFADAVTGGRFHPNGGDYILLEKDVGGGEWYQLYRYDVATGEGYRFVGDESGGPGERSLGDKTGRRRVVAGRLVARRLEDFAKGSAF